MELHYHTDVLSYEPTVLQLNPKKLFDDIAARITQGWHIQFMLPLSNGAIITYVRTTPIPVQLKVDKNN